MASGRACERPASRLPLPKDAEVLGAGLGGIVRSKENVVSIAGPGVHERDNRESGGLVQAVGGEGTFWRARHTAPRYAEEFRITSGFMPHSRPPRGKRKVLRPNRMFRI